MIGCALLATLAAQQYMQVGRLLAVVILCVKSSTVFYRLLEQREESLPLQE